MTKKIIDSLEKNLGDKFITVGTKDKWEGQEINVTSDPLIDTGTGKPVILRFFEYKANPEKFRSSLTNQEIFNNHAQQIKLFLWNDGLEPIEVIEPRIIRAKKDMGYRIVIGCQPRPGKVLLEKPQTLQQTIRNGKNNRRQT
jgi:hypothetical protein